MLLIIGLVDTDLLTSEEIESCNVSYFKEN